VPKYGQKVAPNLNVRQICPNCRHDPPNIVEEYSKGDLVCADCGTILGDRIVDTRSEWRTFAGDEGGDDPSRVGDAGNPLLGNLMGTAISSQDDRSGQARDLQRAQARVNNLSNGANSLASLTAAFSRISERCEALQLPRNVVLRAQHIYKIAYEKKVVKPRNEKAVVAACIYFAGRDVGAERSLPEICRATVVHKKEFGQAISAVKIALTEERLAAGKALAGISSVERSADGLIARFINYLDLSVTIFNAAKHIVAEATVKADIEGRNPVSVAGGVLYFTCILFEIPISAKDIEKVATVRSSTIKLVCNRIARKLDVVIRPEWKTAHPAGYAHLVAMVTEPSAKPSRASTPKLNGDDVPPRLTGDDVPSSTLGSPDGSEKEKFEGSKKGGYPLQVKVNGHINGNGNGHGHVDEGNGDANPASTKNGTNGVNGHQQANGVNHNAHGMNGFSNDEPLVLVVNANGNGHGNGH